MSENQTPNAPESKMSTPSKTRSLETYEAKVKKQQEAIDGLNKQKLMCDNFISKINEEIEKINANIDSENARQKERIEFLKAEVGKKLEATKEANKKKEEIAKEAKIFSPEEFKQTKEVLATIKAEFESIKSDYSKQISEFMNEYKLKVNDIKKLVLDVFSAPSEEAERKTNKENEELMVKIRETAMEIDSQMKKITMNNEHDEKKYAEQGIDADDVPTKVIRLSNYTAKWLLANRDFLSKRW